MRKKKKQDGAPSTMRSRRVSKERGGSHVGKWVYCVTGIALRGTGKARKKKDKLCREDFLQLDACPSMNDKRLFWRNLHEGRVKKRRSSRMGKKT